MDKRQLFNTLLSQITHIIHSDGTTESKLHAICNLLRDNVPGYDWVGFYLVNPHTDELVLGPFAGKPTIHTRIPFGRGICGRVAHTKQPLIVPDVSKEANYLACDINVRSEAVIPIFLDNNFVAELDIDSHLPSAFTDEDKDFLIKVCELVAPLFHLRSGIL